MENVFSAGKAQAAETERMGVELEFSVHTDPREEIKFMKEIPNQGVTRA